MTTSQFSHILQSLKKLNSEDLDDDNSLKLNELFDSCSQLRDLIEESNLPSIDSEIQEAVQVCIKSLERCTLMVNALELFSSNETVEDLQTSTIKFLLIPALLGFLNLFTETTLLERIKFLEIAEVYFKDFLLRCGNYELCATSVKYVSDISSEEKEPPASDPSSVRHQLILQYVKKKELLEREKLLKPALQRGESEDYIREYYLIVLERWAVIAAQELETIKREKNVLNSLSKTEKSQKNCTTERKVESKPLKPFIITKNAVQKQIFGLGYPSMPIMTIDDFYRQRFEKALEEQKQDKIEEQKLNKNKKSLQDAALNGEGLNKEDKEVEKEKLLEKDDFATLMKARQWDDWKDENPRGSGNRYNRG